MQSADRRLRYMQFDDVSRAMCSSRLALLFGAMVSATLIEKSRFGLSLRRDQAG